MASSETAICNAALIKVGGARILALSDTTREGKLCNELYSQVRDELLFDHPWNFATGRATLAETVTTPEFEFAKSYQLPANCLRVRSMEGEETYPWKVEGTTLVTDYGSAKISYTKRVTDVSSFSPGFTKALVSELAYRLCYALTQSTSLSNSLESRAHTDLRLARTADSQEGAGDRFYADSWLNSRY